MKGKAKKKPVIIDYFIWKGNLDSVVEWVKSFKDEPEDHLYYSDIEKDIEFKIKTLEGSSYEVPLGYVIIRGVQGEYYPCDPEIFKETYDIL